MMAANAAKVAASPPQPQPQLQPQPPGEPQPQPLLPQDKQDELHQNEGSLNMRAGEDLLPVGDGGAIGPGPGPAAAPAPAAPAPADRPAAAAAPGAAAPGAAAAEGDIVHAEGSGEGEGFDNNEQEGEFPPDEAMAAAEARAKAAEDRAEAAAARAEAAEREAAAAANRAEAAESRAAKAEADLKLIEQEATGTCDLIAKLEKEVKELKQQLEKKKNPVTSGSSSSSPKPAAVPKHPVPVRSAPISALKKPAGPLGEVDSDEDEEQRRLEAGSPEAAASNELPAARATAAATAEPPAAMPPATKPLAAKRPQPSPAPRPPPKSPRLIEKAAARPSKCYFDGRELDSGEYRCTRDPIVSSGKMRLCSAPSCLAGPDACSAAAFHPFCYFDYYNILGQFSLSVDFTPFQCPACDDPAKSH